MAGPTVENGGVEVHSRMTQNLDELVTNSYGIKGVSFLLFSIMT